MRSRVLAVAGMLVCVPAFVYGQFDFKIAGKQVQIHSFASQGFVYSNGNNYLTMKTSDGSFAMTDGGVNVSMRLTDRFRIGAQAYARNVGRLGNGQVQLDWAYGDYRFASWFGVRGGKIKTALGLYNDTQDLESLHTWALLPQAAYPLDLRASTIAHTGADIYGDIPLGKAGSVSYTAYGGSRPRDNRGDKAYVLADYGVTTTGISGRIAGGDLRWNTPAPGLEVGASYANIDYHGDALYSSYKIPLDIQTKSDSINAFYARFARGKFQFDAEYRRNWEVVGFKTVLQFPDVQADQRSWYVAGSYRFNRWLQVGTYRSQYVYDARLSSDPASNHIYDQTVTARFDLAKFWSVKVEGHFIDGYGSPTSSHGFYQVDNQGGLKPNTRLLVIRTGWSF